MKINTIPYINSNRSALLIVNYDDGTCAEIKDLNFSSSNENVLTLHEYRKGESINGTIYTDRFGKAIVATGISQGEAIVTVSQKDKPENILTTTVQVDMFYIKDSNGNKIDQNHPLVLQEGDFETVTIYLADSAVADLENVTWTAHNSMMLGGRIANLPISGTGSLDVDGLYAYATEDSYGFAGTYGSPITLMANGFCRVIKRQDDNTLTSVSKQDGNSTHYFVYDAKNTASIRQLRDGTHVKEVYHDGMDITDCVDFHGNPITNPVAGVTDLWLPVESDGGWKFDNAKGFFVGSEYVNFNTQSFAVCGGKWDGDSFSGAPTVELKLIEGQTNYASGWNYGKIEDDDDTHYKVNWEISLDGQNWNSSLSNEYINVTVHQDSQWGDYINFDANDGQWIEMVMKKPGTVWMRATFKAVFYNNRIDSGGTPSHESASQIYTFKVTRPETLSGCKFVSWNESWWTSEEVDGQVVVTPTATKQYSSECFLYHRGYTPIHFSLTPTLTE